MKLPSSAQTNGIKRCATSGSVGVRGFSLVATRRCGVGRGMRSHPKGAPVALLVSIANWISPGSWKEISAILPLT